MLTTAYRFEVPEDGEYQPHTWVVADDIIICLTQKGDISNETWSRFVEDVKRPQTLAVLGLSIGSVSINSVQRKAIAEAVEGKRLAAVLDSAIARGILTAMSWFGVTVKSFSWENIDRAIAYVGGTSRDLKEPVSKLLSSSHAPSLAELAS